MWALDLREKFAFVIVGGFCAACYLSLAWVLHYLGLSPAASSAGAYVLCLPLGYFGHRSITFRSARRHGRASLAYFTVQGIAVLIVTAATFHPAPATAGKAEAAASASPAQMTHLPQRMENRSRTPSICSIEAPAQLRIL